ncbi:MAG: hypothetical protein AAGF67_14475 [Verrucomicrobiota bacterium]
MKERLVIPEILDSLPHDDPEAKRSRRDLNRINALMGNYRWGSARILDSDLKNWTELGAGAGHLSEFADDFDQEIHLAALDLAPRPAFWPEHWDWNQEDLFEFLPSLEGGKSHGIFSVLFLHHFESEALGKLGDMIQNSFTRVVFAEPARFRIFWLLSHALLPVVNRVTRHDMLVSIRAGFRKGELVSLLGLGKDWEVRETVHWLGGLRFEAWRKS